MTSPVILLRSLSYTGPSKPEALVTFQRGLNVVCGASDTGKSFIAESIDFMLGGGDTPSEIEQRRGYDTASLTIELPEEQKVFRLDRSTGGGDFRRHDISTELPPVNLLAKHAQGRENSLSAWLLGVVGLPAKMVRRNRLGVLRSLSFRDIARLVILQQGEISSKVSPYLTGQFVLKPAEMSALKLVLTGADDSSLVQGPASEEEKGADAKIEIIESLIAQLRTEANENVSDAELAGQRDLLEQGVASAEFELLEVQQQLDDRLDLRKRAYAELAQLEARREEVAGLLSRFDLLRQHYSVDLERLRAIAETGRLISHYPSTACPLCGASPEHHLPGPDCDGDVVGVAEAAEGEQGRIRHLLRELESTVGELEVESISLTESAGKVALRANELDSQIASTLTPSLRGVRGSYAGLVAKLAEVRRELELRERISDFEARRRSLLSASRTEVARPDVMAHVSKSVLNDLCLAVERILVAWNFPGAGRVTFDERTFDFVCGGKPRASFGAGFRAVISAAASIGLLEFCQAHERPHPGFVVLESPLLAYWKPESAQDNLKGSDLKNRFYEYLDEVHRHNQVLVIENEHPPLSLDLGARLTVFTRNPNEGRFGFFPLA